MMLARVVVEEEDYAVVARVSDRDEHGEEVPRSDRIATAMRMAWSAEARTGRTAVVVESDEGPAAVVEMGDAPESAFEETAGTLLDIAASW